MTGRGSKKRATYQDHRSEEAAAKHVFTELASHENREKGSFRSKSETLSRF